MSKIDWANELRKVDPCKKYYRYEECEKAAFNVKFGMGNWIVIERDQDDYYAGETRIIIQNFKDFFECKYDWGSCSGCDTLEGAGEEAACKLIYGEIKPKNNNSGQNLDD